MTPVAKAEITYHQVLLCKSGLIFRSSTRLSRYVTSRRNFAPFNFCNARGEGGGPVTSAVVSDCACQTLSENVILCRKPMVRLQSHDGAQPGALSLSNIWGTGGERCGEVFLVAKCRRNRRRHNSEPLPCHPYRVHCYVFLSWNLPWCAGLQCLRWHCVENLFGGGLQLPHPRLHWQLCQDRHKRHNEQCEPRGLGWGGAIPGTYGAKKGLGLGERSCSGLLRAAPPPQWLEDDLRIWAHTCPTSFENKDTTFLRTTIHFYNLRLKESSSAVTGIFCFVIRSRIQPMWNSDIMHCNALLHKDTQCGIFDFLKQTSRLKGHLKSLLLTLATNQRNRNGGTHCWLCLLWTGK